MFQKISMVMLFFLFKKKNLLISCPDTTNAAKAHLDRKTKMKHFQSWIGLPTAGTSTLPKQCGIILTQNKTKGCQNPMKSFERPSRSLENYS